MDCSYGHEMIKRSDRIAVFRSTDPDAYAQAVTLLKAARIPFSRGDTNEGGSRTPHRVHWLMVSRDHEEAARAALVGVPSEIILPDHAAPPSRADRIVARIQAAVLIGLLIYAVITFIRELW